MSALRQQMIRAMQQRGFSLKTCLPVPRPGVNLPFLHQN